MDDIKKIVKQVISDISVKKPDTHFKIQEIFKDIVGKNGTKHAHIIGIRDDHIMICVDSPAWLYQMNMMRKKFKENLKKEKIEIKKISFKIGKIH